MVQNKNAKVPIVKTLAFTAIFNYSHSIVAGGFVVTSYTTLLMDLTSFTILLEHTARTSYGMRENSAVMKSVVSTKFMLLFLCK